MAARERVASSRDPLEEAWRSPSGDAVLGAPAAESRGSTSSRPEEITEEEIEAKDEGHGRQRSRGLRVAGSGEAGEGSQGWAAPPVP